MSDAIALLIFARPVADEATRKRLTRQVGQNRRALHRLTEHVTQTTTATGLPVLRSADLITHRGSFGHQLSSALQAVFDQGFADVIVIGNDCPGLTVNTLCDAANALRSAPVVLGPDRRGGLYLLGLSQAAFAQNRLAGLPWQTPALHRATRLAFDDGPVTMLARLGDINQLIDLQTYQSDKLTITALIAALLTLAAERSTPGSGLVIALITPVDWPSSGSLRGPPARLCQPFAVV